MRTSSPRPAQCLATALPTRPAAPVTKTFNLPRPPFRIAAGSSLDRRRSELFQSIANSLYTRRWSSANRFPTSQAAATRAQILHAKDLSHSADHVRACPSQSELGTSAFPERPTLIRRLRRCVVHCARPGCKPLLIFLFPKLAAKPGNDRLRKSNPVRFYRHRKVEWADRSKHLISPKEEIFPETGGDHNCF